ncbi:ribonuclease R family protein [Pseudanabaena sp. PCC 6802]|uniref:ribonuclease R family protein n=1 Tax=Pseudanabaena sp. PCC 6802 TaxID=118173 RepID=UPI00034DB525|nr:ribonuclease R family protein [Pseudanabaena sp. PCC 6802]
MEFSISQLLDSLSDKFVAPKVIEKKLGIGDDGSIRKLQVALDALERVGILEKDKGRYRRLAEDGLVEGRLRCSSKGFCFAIQDVEGAGDIYIRESKLSTAWNGDRVLVKVTKDGMRRRSPEGEVRLIVERSNPTLLAKVKAFESGYRAIPLDDRLLFEIDLAPDRQYPDLSVALNKLVHLEMTRFPLGSHLPIGKILQVLGDDAESTPDVDLVCCKHNLPRKFSSQVLTAVNSLPKAVRKVDLKKRLDLRQNMTVAIGNAPAISLESTQAGGWRLGVHIPDYAAYIAVGSVLDEAARLRVRTSFLDDSVIPMLPDLGVLQQPEHLTMSVLFELDSNGVLTEFEIYPSAIATHARLSFAEAQEIIDDRAQKGTAKSKQAELADLLGNIVHLGTSIKQHRLGSFHITLPNAPMQEADEGILGVPIVPEANYIYGMVSEMSILANRAIATHLVALGVPALFRTQSPPELSKVADWLKLCESMGVSVGLAEPEHLQSQDFQNFLAQVTQVDRQSSCDILKYLLMSLLKIGEYSLQPGSHFGLALAPEFPYVHAIAPQHRYVDLLIQRLLHLVFQEGRDRRNTRSKESVDLHSSSCHGQISWSVLPPERERQVVSELELILPKLNQQDNLVHKAKTDLEGLRKAEIMQARTGQNFFGIITGVQSYGFFVEIESLLVEGLVHVSSLKDDWYEFPQTNGKSKGGRAQTVLIGRRSERQYSLGDRIEVQVKSVDYYRQQIDLVALASIDAAANLEPGEQVVLPTEIDPDLDMDRFPDE